MTKNLLIANIAVFVLGIFAGNVFAKLGAFTINTAIFGGQIWRFLTFQFLHADFFHLLFNMIGLYFFGPQLERFWGAKRFLSFYLLCGVAGAAFYTLLYFLQVFRDTGINTALVGASAGIYGLLIAIAVIAPKERIRLLFPPIEMSMRTSALIFLAIAVLTIVQQGYNAGGEAGHLGGAILGFLLTKFTGGLAFLDRDAEVKIIRPKAFQRRSEAKLRPRSTSAVDDPSEIDRILEKVHNDGMHSLTDAEREILQKASESSRHRKS